MDFFLLKTVSKKIPSAYHCVKFLVTASAIKGRPIFQLSLSLHQSRADKRPDLLGFLLMSEFPKKKFGRRYLHTLRMQIFVNPNRLVATKVIHLLNKQ